MCNPEKVDIPAFSYYEQLRKVKQYFDQHQDESLSLRKAASIAGLEEKYFSAFFHAKTGLCFKDWLACVRVARAIELMRAHDQTITFIAFAVGFQDLRTFERAFKRCTGVTPLAFKSSVRPG